MSTPSQTNFSRSIKTHIRWQYHNRCAICLNLFPENSIQVAHLIDSASLDLAVNLEVLTANYQWNSSINGMPLCGVCHLNYFTPNYIALSPPIPVLHYIVDYLLNTPTAVKKPLHQVFDLLQRARTGENVPLPDPTPIFPFLGLFTIVALRPDELLGYVIGTRHRPGLSHLQGGNPSASHGDIPLSSQHAEFKQQRYWRLPVSINAVLAVLMYRAVNLRISEIPEIKIAQHINCIIRLQHDGYIISKPLPTVRGGQSGEGYSGGDEGGGLPSGNEKTEGRGGVKRVLRSNDRANPPLKKGKTNMCASEVLDEPDVSQSRSGGLDKSEPSDRSNSERIHHGVNPDEWEVASSFSYDERLQTKVLSEYSIATQTSSAKRDSESVIDDPKKWRFGPFYRSDMIIVAAGGISLV